MPSSPIKLFLDHPESTLAWLDHPGGRVFNEWLKNRHDHYEVKLRSSDNVAELHRAQGALEVVGFLRNMREEIRQYQRDVLAKRATPPPVARRNVNLAEEENHELV